MKKTWTCSLMAVFLFGISAMVASDASAGISAPTVGSLFYEAWDLGVNQVLHGAFGVLLGVALVAFGVWEAAHTKLKGAIASVIGGILLLKADTLVTGASAIF
jgi:hypothetical protein